MDLVYGFTVDESAIVCPKCARSYAKDDLESVTRGYPDGYTCDDCGKVVD